MAETMRDNKGKKILMHNKFKGLKREVGQYVFVNYEEGIFLGVYEEKVRNSTTTKTV